MCQRVPDHDPDDGATLAELVCGHDHRELLAELAELRERVATLEADRDEHAATLDQHDFAIYDLQGSVRAASDYHA